MVLRKGMRHRTDIGNLRKTVEHRVFRYPRKSVKCLHILQHINPTVKIILTSLSFLLEKKAFLAIPPNEHADFYALGRLSLLPPRR